MHPRDYPSNFCVSEEHCVILIIHCVRPWDLPSTSINFSCVCASEFRLTFYVTAGPFVNFPCFRGTFHPLTLTFRAAARSFANFSCGRGTFRKLPSIFWAPARLSVGFCLLSLSTHTFHPLTLTFRAAARPCVHFPYAHGIFRQTFVRQRHLL